MNTALEAVEHSPGNPGPNFDDTLIVLKWGHAFNDGDNEKCVILARIDDLYLNVSRSQQMKLTTMHATVSCTEIQKQKSTTLPWLQHISIKLFGALFQRK